MKLVLFLLFGLIPLCGFSQIELRKFEKVVDYINWKYTENIIQQLKKSGKKNWPPVKINSIEETPTRDSLEQVLTKFPSELNDFSRLIDDKKSSFSEDQEISEIEIVLNTLPTKLQIYDKDFSVDRRVTEKSIRESLKYLHLKNPNEEYNKNFDSNISNQVGKEIDTIKSQYSIIFWPYFAHLIFLLLFILTIGILILYFEYVKVVDILQSLNQKSPYSSNKPFNSFAIAPAFKLTDDDKQIIKNDVIAEIRKSLTQEPNFYKEDGLPINNGSFVPYHQNSQTFIKYYFAAPFGNGFSDQYKTEQIIEDKSLYILEVDSTGQRGKFRLLNEPWMIRFAVNERQRYIDPVCKIDGKFTQQASSIKVVKEGEATLSNGHWSVSDSQKALISYD